MTDARPGARDLVVTGAVLLIGMLGISIAPPDQPGFRDRDLLGYLLTVAQGLPLLWRRRWALAVVGVTWAATVLFLVLRYPPVTSAFAGIAAATYAAAAYGSALVRVWITAALGGALAVAAVVAVYTPPEGLVLVLVLVTAWVMGDRALTRRSYLQALEERSALLERERKREVEAAGAAERTRIARELHDVIAHGVSVIVLHARGAREVMGRDDDEARRSLELIEQTGRDALQELRVVLGALRGQDRSDGLEPQQGLAQLDSLARRTEEAGLGVDVAVEGTQLPLPPSVDLAAFRVIQEALANTMKHSTATRASVVLRYEGEHLVVQVTDDGTPAQASATSGGHGLLGMRERVATLGGRLEVGNREGGGFAVLAVLPVADGR